MQRMFLRPRSLYNSVSTKGAKYPDTTTRFLYLSNTCGRSWYQRKILRLTRKYKLISKIFTRIPIFSILNLSISIISFQIKLNFFISMLLRLLFFLIHRNMYAKKKKKKNLHLLSQYFSSISSKSVWKKENVIR